MKHIYFVNRRNALGIMLDTEGPDVVTTDKKKALKAYHAQSVPGCGGYVEMRVLRTAEGDTKTVLKRGETQC